MSENNEILSNEEMINRQIDVNQHIMVQVKNMAIEMANLHNENKKMHECLVKVLNYLNSPEDQEAEYIERLICEALKQYHIKP